MQKTRVSGFAFRHNRPAISKALATVFCLSPIVALAQAPVSTAPTPPGRDSKTTLKVTEPPKSPAEGYLISAGDSLEVAVLLHPELSKVVTVAPDGRISYPYIGVIDVVGLTLTGFAQKIQDGLSKEITEPHVNITLLKRAERTVSILGSGIHSPGKRVLNGDWRILDLVAEGGGLNTLRTDLVTATLFRRDNSIVPIDLTALMGQGDTSQNIKLEAGDTLIVEQRDVTRTHVLVQGEVLKPGWVVVPEDNSLLSVLTAVGGATPQASLSHAAIKREGKIIPVDLSKLNTNVEAATFVVKPGDMVFIPMNKQMYAVFGAVAAPKVYAFPDNEPLTLVRAIANAGGVLTDADLKKATVLRGGANASRARDQQMQQQAVEDVSKVAGVFVRANMISTGNPVFFPTNDTLPTSILPADRLSNGVAVTLRNGYSTYFSATGEAGVIPINLESILSKGGNLDRDIPLNPGDIVFVPSKTAGRKGFSITDALSFVPVMGWFLR